MNSATNSMGIALTPKQALNKAFLKKKPERNLIDNFKLELSKLLSNIDDSESEENQKNHLSNFLKSTQFHESFAINTKDRIDLAVHVGPSNKENVGVIIEVKRGENKAEMLRKQSINTKALHELVLYYLRERVINKNLDIKNIVATNIYEWFIFDATTFEKNFGENSKLIKHFIEFSDGKMPGKDTSFFYEKIAKEYIDNSLSSLEYTYFNLKDYEGYLHEKSGENDAKFIPLFKVLSPEHLLKLPFTNDSNSLDKNFYGELLHIIGLNETKAGTRKIIQRCPEKIRNSSSLLESAIFQLSDEVSNADECFYIALELVITWVNRILFLKLLEAQQINYHKGDIKYAFLNKNLLAGYDDLNNLFFKVLAIRTSERHDFVKSRFSHVPYLNSSLFEKTDLESKYFPISQLTDGTLPVYDSSVLKDSTGKRRHGSLNALEYLFQFLDSYDFSSEGAEEIQESNKTLINASVLGLIFEKINGYKDGAYFTPGFITMYMCRETIRMTVIEKFNSIKSWDVASITDLYNKITDKKEANEIINSLKICDPSVGSGHFLVSTLNEILAIKSELGILVDKSGKLLRDYRLSVENDELIITNEDGSIYSYNPKNPENRRIQETIFAEKQTIIENCLFGVDINPNSVKICRLRLWIELLKNTFYTENSNFSELETLPNIDINIKCGNSLVSRFDIDVDIKRELKKLKYSVQQYKDAVLKYKNASSKSEKTELEELIRDIKSNFKTEVENNDKRVLAKKRAQSDLEKMNQIELFELSKSEKRERETKKELLVEKISKIEKEIQEIKNNKIYSDAFEWRLEFPEVLNDDGDFVGFDVIIGNPPYGANIDKHTVYFKSVYPSTSHGFKDIYKYFYEKSFQLLRSSGKLSFIAPNTYLRQPRYGDLRKYLLQFNILTIFDLGENIFDAVVPTCISIIKNNKIDLGSVMYYDATHASDKVRSLYEVSPVVMEQTAFTNSQNNIFTPDAISNSNGELTFDDVLDFKDAGINYQRVNVGLGEKGKSDLSDRLLYEGKAKENSTDKEYWKGTDIDQYFIAEKTGRFCRTSISLRDNERVILNAKYFALCPKLIWRQTAPHLIAAVDYNGIWFGRSVQAAIIKQKYIDKLSYEYLCAVFNSTYIRTEYEKSVKETGRVFPQVKLEKIKSLKISIPSEKQKQLIEQLVLKAIELKKQGKGNEFDAVIMRIDNSVSAILSETAAV